MNSDDAIILCLPEPGAAETGVVHWWRVSGGHIVTSGDTGDAVPSLSPDAATHVLAIAPAAACVMHQLSIADMAPKQALAVALRMIAQDGPDTADALHLAAVGTPGEPAPGVYVSVLRSAMATWTAWLAARGLTASSIVPAPLLLPRDSEPRQGRVGAEEIIRIGDTAFLAEPALVDALLPAGTTANPVAPEQVERAMIAACDEAPAELLSGAWARRTQWRFDTSALPRLLKLTAALLLISLAIPLAQILLLHRDASRLDSDAASAAARIVSPAPPIDTASGALDQKLAQMGGGPALVSTPIAALVSAMEPAPTVSIDAIDWRGDGVLSVTLGGPRNEDINPVLEKIQRDGYRITAQARAGTDGRALADITIRSGP